MKTALALLFVAALTAHGELLTITLDSSVTNRSEAITINELQTIRLKTVWTSQACTTSSSGDQPALNWNIHGLSFTNGYQSFSDTTSTFVGPVTVYLTSFNCAAKVAATFEIQPSPFPPDKTLTLGAFSGNVKVTMEESTDLVNWTAAVNGLLHTNAPDARFFRIKMERNAAP